jgi:hypothetical protein
MKRSGSHPNHENRKIIISTVLIRRGGVLPGAAVFTMFQGTRVSIPSVIPEDPFKMKIGSLSCCMLVAFPALYLFFGENHLHEPDAPGASPRR